VPACIYLQEQAHSGGASRSLRVQRFSSRLSGVPAETAQLKFRASAEHDFSSPRRL